ncbi:hypothetical protein K466DRAFT_570591, partial [Polyporus arcularius HHB13444]
LAREDAYVHTITHFPGAEYDNCYRLSCCVMVEETETGKAPWESDWDSNAMQEGDVEDAVDDVDTHRDDAACDYHSSRDTQHGRGGISRHSSDSSDAPELDDIADGARMLTTDAGVECCYLRKLARPKFDYPIDLDGHGRVEYLIACEHERGWLTGWMDKESCPANREGCSSGDAARDVLRNLDTSFGGRCERKPPMGIVGMPMTPFVTTETRGPSLEFLKQHPGNTSLNWLAKPWNNELRRMNRITTFEMWRLAWTHALECEEEIAAGPGHVGSTTTGLEKTIRGMFGRPWSCQGRPKALDARRMVCSTKEHTREILPGGSSLRCGDSHRRTLLSLRRRQRLGQAMSGRRLAAWKRTLLRAVDVHMSRQPSDANSRGITGIMSRRGHLSYGRSAHNGGTIPVDVGPWGNCARRESINEICLLPMNLVRAAVHIGIVAILRCRQSSNGSHVEALAMSPDKTLIQAREASHVGFRVVPENTVQSGALSDASGPDREHVLKVDTDEGRLFGITDASLPPQWRGDTTTPCRRSMRHRPATFHAAMANVRESEGES